MSLGLLFPGQGTQHADMLGWLDADAAARPVLDELARRLGADWRERLSDARWASSAEVGQLLVTAMSLAAWAALAPRLPAPAAVLGYSVGELAAFTVAGVLPATQTLALAARRAAAMAAASTQPLGLLAVQGRSLNELIALGAAFGLEPAILLEADQLLLGGPQAALGQARAQWEAQGLRCTAIAAPVASHTRWMAPAQPAWQAALQDLTLQRPRAALICDAEAGPVFGADAARAALVDQLARPIDWPRCMDALAERGVRVVLEVGPGQTLARLWARRHPQIPVRSVDEFGSAAGVAAWVAERLAP
ncbi:MAG: ACP S-malonyltransferase [Roseateles depolymerans]|uniref:ACP S-malonyltransferase n=1 Tax=Roseateles depolymerans TaxID=76731 RepID=A0A2W5FNK5_9BURK|nr:MAG: ACP S-malonyltransferase [Roseateles depolymerans]PZR22945.1 MAG: ACP S-malonyltransferase [Azospira oryzae]